MLIGNQPGCRSCCRWGKTWNVLVELSHPSENLHRQIGGSPEREKEVTSRFTTNNKQWSFSVDAKESQKNFTRIDRLIHKAKASKNIYKKNLAGVDSLVHLLKQLCGSTNTTRCRTEALRCCRCCLCCRCCRLFPCLSFLLRLLSFL